MSSQTSSTKQRTPGKMLRAIRGNWGSLPRLLLLFWQSGRKEVIFLLVVSLANGVAPVVQLIFLRRLIDSALSFISGRESLSTVLVWLVLLLLAYIAGNILLQTEHWIGDGVQELLKARIQECLLTNAGQLPLGQFESAAYYDQLERAQKGVDNRIFSTLAFMVRIPSTFFSIVSLLFYVALGSPFFPFLLLIGTLIPLTLIIPHNKKRYLVERKLTGEERRLNYFEEMLRTRPAAAELRLFHLQDHFLQLRRHIFNGLRDHRLQQERKLVVTSIIGDGGQTLTLGLTLSGVVTLMAEGSFSLGAYATYFNAVIQFQQFLFSFLWDITIIDRDMQYIKDIFEYLDLVQPSQSPNINTKAQQTPNVPAIQFEQVSFTYPGTEQPVLRELNLRIQPGERIALIGENGAGKSTLAKLLLGLYQPTEGRIFVDDKNLRELNFTSWRTQCAMVFQDFMRYQVTARDNIGFGDIRQLNNEPAICSAALKSGADEMIQRLPQQYETTLGKAYDENGQDLSGGQWQKLALARAYMRNAAVLVLDEPTAALDARAEVEVYRQFRDISHGKSALLISHRLGSARLADRIIVLENGRIVEEGTHSELLAHDGLYAGMFKLQAHWYQ
ncbi:ABC transporter ATP-binding protein [Dictyobacter formicarum]|uniref:HlyB/MsbA family ABC transporter n=1 Tax=Dictyobacter formicarum TaxID=2778368 RepID=A0ABQ3VHH1_9CHLR|nr:ABC transporter ATP-binding protein [Dictyobacter formicarum]GHO85149.1 HlyB/MsbA family ABC transporter [Dictyobacter formicarum]